MSITTKTGDAGLTKLYAGQKISKSDLRIEACGAIDEMNSALGLARALCDDAAISAQIEALQRESFVVAAEMATPPESLGKLKMRVDAAMTARLEALAASIEDMEGIVGDWSLPGATAAGAGIDMARTIARRAERTVVRLAEADGVPNEEVLRYMNRISDLLWLLGRRYEVERSINSALRPERG